MAVMATLFVEYTSDSSVDLLRVIKMALIHDIVEIDAGDTFAYDDEGLLSKAAREQAAAERIFGLLPPDQRADNLALWREFEAMETPDARYAAALDCLQPLIHNLMTDGHTWKNACVTREKVLRRMDIIRTATPALWPFVEYAIQTGVDNGWLEK